MSFEHISTRQLGRRTFIRNAASTTLGVVAGGSILAACGDSSNGTTAQTGPTVVKINTMPSKASDPNGYKLWNQTANDWSKKHASYKIQGVEGWFDPTSFYPMFAAGTAPDVFQTFFTEPQYMIQKHIAADITTYLQKSPYANIFSPGALAVVSDSSNHVHGLPFGAYRLAIMYNRTVFQKAGLDPDKPPLTWDDFRAYAKQIAQKTGVTGFVECAAGNQGGWHFTNWLYSAGGKVEDTQNGKLTAMFNSDLGQAVLQLFHDMRWTDGSMAKQQASFQQNNTADLVASGAAGMCIGGIGTPANYYKGKGSIDHLSVSPMPQKDGGNNGCLAGGNVWIFNSKSKPEVLQGGFDFESYETYDLGNYEEGIKAAAADNKVVGLPETAIFTGDYLKKMLDINSKYVNVPVKNYQTYADSTLPIVPEPRVHSQDFYALLDPIVQAAFTQKNADLKQMLNSAATTFQSRYLDTAS